MLAGRQRTSYATPGPKGRDRVREAARYRAARRALGWSQEEAALRLGVTWKTYGRWERGKPGQAAALELLESLAFTRGRLGRFTLELRKVTASRRTRRTPSPRRKKHGGKTHG